MKDACSADYLSYRLYPFTMACIPYVVMIHLIEQARLTELETERKTFAGNSQKLCLPKQCNLIDPNSLQTHHFRLTYI